MCAIPEIIVLMPLIWKVWVKSMIMIQNIWVSVREWLSECVNERVNAGTIPASPTRSGTHRSVSQAAWPCDSSSSRVALVASRWADLVQAVLAGSQVAWDTRRNISQIFWHRLPIFQVDLHCVLHRAATLSCRGHVNELATKPVLLLHREHGTGYQRSWNCCDRRTCFVVIWKHFCFILSIDSVMCPRSSSRGHNTNASVIVTVTVKKWMSEWII